MKKLLNFLRGLWRKALPEQPPVIIPEATPEPIPPVPQVPDLDVMVGKIKDLEVDILGTPFKFPTWPKTVPQTGGTVPGRTTIDSPVWDSLQKLNEDFPVRAITSIHEYSDEEIDLLPKLIRGSDITHESTDRVMDSVFMNFKTSRDIEVSVQLKNEIYVTGIFAECGYISVTVKNAEPRYYWILFSTPHTAVVMGDKSGRPSLVAIATQVRKFIHDSELPEDRCIYKITTHETEIQFLDIQPQKRCCSRSILRTNERPWHDLGDFLYDPKISSRCMADAGEEYIVEDGVLCERIERAED